MIRDRRAILALLTALNFVNYIDRAVMAAVLTPMKAELGLSNFEAGLLNTAFLVGYFATSPWFGARADKRARMGLIALGIVVWSIATVASGFAVGFWSLLAARIAVGVGEASFTVLAPTVIDDVTPATGKGRALAVFFLAIPLGYALGYILGGSISHAYGWRAAFFMVGGPGVVLGFACLAIAEPARKLADAKDRLLDALKSSAKIPLFRRTVLGYVAYTAALGAFSYWAPNFLLRRFPTELNEATANTRFGLVLIVAGAIGTFVGGQWTDRLQRRLPAVPADAPWDHPGHKAAVNAALRVCAIGALMATPLAAACFWVPSPTVFFGVALVAEIGLFLSTSPVNVAIFRSVPPERRASANAAAVFSIHLFGDLWSSAALGLLQDAMPLQQAMMALPLTFALTTFLWWPRKREAPAPDFPAAVVHRGSR